MSLKTKIVYNGILDMINGLSVGDQIPVEPKLAERFNVSLITIRRAVNILVSEGMLVRKQGSGTFVQKNGTDNKNLEDLPDINDICCAVEERGQSEFIRFSFVEDAENIKIYENLVKSYNEASTGSPYIVLDPRRRDKNACPSYFKDISLGGSPDLFYLFPYQIQWFAKNNIITPLDDYLNEEDFRRIKTLDPTAQSSITYRNKIWMLPKGINVFCLYYNKTLFDKEGISYPDENWDWSRYLEAANALTKDINGDGVPEIYGSCYFRDFQNLEMLLWAYGGDFINSKGNVTVKSDECLKALKFNCDLTMKHGVTLPPRKWRAGLQHQEMFINGELAMFAAPGFYYTKEFKKHKGLDWDITVIPSGPAGRFSPPLFVGSVVSSKTPCPAETVKLLKYITNDNSAAAFAAIGNDFPVRRNSFAIGEFLKHQNKLSPGLFLSMLSYLRNEKFNGAHWPFLYKDLNRMCSEMFLHKEPFEDVVDKTERRMKASMENFLKWNDSKV